MRMFVCAVIFDKYHVCAGISRRDLTCSSFTESKSVNYKFLCEEQSFMYVCMCADGSRAPTQTAQREHVHALHSQREQHIQFFDEESSTFC